MDDLKIIDSNGKTINISVIGFFSIPELKKEFVMYSLLEESSSTQGHVLLGEVVRNGEEIQVLGILSDEKDLVVAYYNEIATQIGDEVNG